jgi:hypothetical protein
MIRVKHFLTELEDSIKDWPKLKNLIPYGHVL